MSRSRSRAGQAARSDTSGDIELTSYRYLVMVSEDFLTMPEDLPSETTVYRCVNTAVKPTVPSVVSQFDSGVVT